MNDKQGGCYMIRIRNREMARMPSAGRKRSCFCNSVLFSVLAAGETFTSSTFQSNIADTYAKVS